MMRMSLPVVLEDGSRLDWPDGRYEPKVRVSMDRANILHRLSGVPSLERALDEGMARWAAEIRCPKTLLSRIALSTAPEHTVNWHPDELDGVSWIVPGLLAVEEFEIRGEELNSFWHGETLLVPSGWWLAQGTKRKVNTLAQSLLRFVKDEKLADGRMHIQPEHGSGHLRFVAHLATDIWPEIQTNRTLQVAALIGVCSHFPTTFGMDPAEEPEVAREIRDRLEMADVPVWTDDGYDAALAATVIEEFRRTLDNDSQKN